MCGVSVARAFQPEFCPLRLECPEIAALWRVRCRTFVSREAAKGDAVGLLWCVLKCLLSSQLSRIYSLWHGCHIPLTPDPSPPFHGGEGRIVCFVAVKKRNSTPRPWKGRGDGGEG